MTRETLTSEFDFEHGFHFPENQYRMSSSGKEVIAFLSETNYYNKTKTSLISFSREGNEIKRGMQKIIYEEEEDE